MDSSAVVDLEGGDESDYELNLAEVPEKKRDQAKPDPGLTQRSNVTQNVTSMVFQAGRERAQKALNIYGNIDMLRPYFDVEPAKVRDRLLHSLIPVLPSVSPQQSVSRELYGPLMVVFSLVALLLFQMKVLHHSMQEGTLMGSAFATCFGYWLGFSGLLWLLAYIANIQLTMAQVLSLLGYGLFGHCVVLFLGTILHTSHDHALFYFLWATLGGLATLRMISLFMGRISGTSQKMLVCGMLAVIHMSFLLYLHFSYHQVVQEFSDAMNAPARPQIIPAIPVDQANALKQDSLHIRTKVWPTVASPKQEAVLRDIDVEPPKKQDMDARNLMPLGQKIPVEDSRNLTIPLQQKLTNIAKPDQKENNPPPLRFSATKKPDVAQEKL